MEPAFFSATPANSSQRANCWSAYHTDDYDSSFKELTQDTTLQDN